MKDKDYNNWVQRQNDVYYDWVNKGKEFRIFENYPVYIKPYDDSTFRFRVHGFIMYFNTDEGMSLEDLAKQIMEDIPYIKNIQFIADWSGAGIVI